jgi:hypothetical protein
MDTTVCNKTITLSNDVAITLIIMVGIFVSLIVIGMFLFLCLHEMRRENGDMG